MFMVTKIALKITWLHHPFLFPEEPKAGLSALPERAHRGGGIWNIPQTVNSFPSSLRCWIAGEKRESQIFMALREVFPFSKYFSGECHPQCCYEDKSRCRGDAKHQLRNSPLVPTSPSELPSHQELAALGPSRPGMCVFLSCTFDFFSLNGLIALGAPAACWHPSCSEFHSLPLMALPSLQVRLQWNRNVSFSLFWFNSGFSTCI